MKVSLPPTGNTHPPFVAGNWYISISAAMAGGSAVPANSVRLLPFMLTQPVTISDLGARVTTLAALGNIRLAIYNSDPATNLPTTVAAQTGDILTTLAQNVSGDITGSNVTLPPGLYWSAVIADVTAGGTVIMQSVTAGTSLATYLIGSATLANLGSGASALALILTFASTYGAFPNLTGQSLTESSTSNSCAVFFKVA